MASRAIPLVPLLLASALIVTGCQTVNVTPYRELNYAPTQEVDVLQSEPTRPYIILAEMWVNANDSNGVLEMRKKAMEMGAHALVLVGDRNAGAVAIPLQGSPGGAVAVPINRTYAAAIRYER